MWKILDQFAHLANRLNERVGKWTAWLNLGLILLVCGDVFTRYLLNKTSPWVTELEWHLFALIFLLGAGFAWKHDRHVRVDLFYARFTPQDKASVNALGTIFFLLPWATVLLIVSWKYAMTSFEIRETSPDPGGLPALYPIKFGICLGILLLILQALTQLITDLQTWLRPGQKP